MKRTIDHIDPQGQRVLVRLDLNVPLDANGGIADDRRLRAAIPTIKKLLSGQARVVMMSHLGRPSGKDDDRQRLSLKPVADRLSALLEQHVPILPECVGSAVKDAVAQLADGQACLLENLRFHRAETIKDKDAAGDTDLRTAKDEFAAGLAGLADIYVNDAFGTCHRDNASMLTVPSMMAGRPRVAGYLVERELQFLGRALHRPQRPFVCLLGGAKVSDKLGVIGALLERCDLILVGGAMAYTFLAAIGKKVGGSLTEPELFDVARQMKGRGGPKLQLPVDSVAAAAIEKGVPTCVCSDEIRGELKGLDIGPRTVEHYRSLIETARTIFWNGPMGVFEMPPFDEGTLAMARAVANATSEGAVSVVGGGDSAAAVERTGLVHRITHVSTGGGAALEFLEGKRFAALEVLDEAP